MEEKLRRFYTEKISPIPTLTGEEHKHLSVVLRMRPGDRVILNTGDGFDYVCEIAEIAKNETRFMLEEKIPNECDPDVDVTLFSALLKSDKNDFVVQKATELGVNTVYPVGTRYAVCRDKGVKTERLNKIAAEAAKQCGRSILTRVHDSIDFATMVKMLKDYPLVVFPYENAAEPPLKKFLAERRGLFGGKIAVIVGPEGGFADEEAEELRAAGVVPVTLGKRILRAETANIAVISALMYEAGQWQ